MIWQTNFIVQFVLSLRILPKATRAPPAKTVLAFLNIHLVLRAKRVIGTTNPGTRSKKKYAIIGSIFLPKLSSCLMCLHLTNVKRVFAKSNLNTTCHNHRASRSIRKYHSLKSLSTFYLLFTDNENQPHLSSTMLGISL